MLLIGENALQKLAILMTVEHISQKWDWVMPRCLAEHVLRELNKYIGPFEGISLKIFSFIAENQNFVVNFKSKTKNDTFSDGTEIF